MKVTAKAADALGRTGVHFGSQSECDKQGDDRELNSKIGNSSSDTLNTLLLCDK